MASFNLRLPDDLYAKLKELSKRERRSVNSQIIVIISQWVRSREVKGDG